MTTATDTTTVVQRIYIKATPEQIWDAITHSEWTNRYGYGGGVEYDLRPGGTYRAFASDAMRAQGASEVIVEGEVLEADPPRRLVQTWHALFDAETVAEEPGRLTWELERHFNNGTQVTLTHELDGAPKTAGFVSGAVPEAGGGWAFVLSDLKTLLETGKSLAE